jgi:putative addiction module component (TIGR02574 family)
MGQIVLHPDHVVVRSYEADEPVWPGSVLDLAPYFFHSVEIDPAYTMGDLFRLLDRDDVEFLEAVIGESVAPLLEESREPPRGHEDVRLDFLRVNNLHGHGEIFREFDGWGPWDEPYDGAWEKEPDMPREGAVSVSLTPVNQLLDVPLRYDPDLVFHDAAGAEEYRTRIGISFLEFVKAIFYDLTFHGPPAQRDAMRAELQRRVEEIDRGEAELIPAEELFARLRERQDPPED